MILMSIFRDIPHIARAVGVRDFLKKPFRLEQLLEVVNCALRRIE